MIAPHGQLRIYVATRPIDFRKGMDGLTLAAQELFVLDPFSGAAFDFRSKRADRIKVLIWDRTGLVLVQKRLDGAKLVWPQVQDRVLKMSPAQFAVLFGGVDWRLVRPEAARRPQLAGQLRANDSGASLGMAFGLAICLIQHMSDTALAEEKAHLKACFAETEAALAEALEALQQLECILAELHRDRFGAKSAKLDPEQFRLPLEDVEIAQAILEAAQERTQRALKTVSSAAPRPTKRNRSHLLRIERVS